MPDDQDWYGADTATFGDRLAGAREAAGLSQKELATKLGVRPKVIAGWENDLGEPRANRLQMLAGILGVSMSWLLTGAGEGLDAPGTPGEISEDVMDLLTELRSLRGEIALSGERLARLEKRLRAALKEGHG